MQQLIKAVALSTHNIQCLKHKNKKRNNEMKKVNKLTSKYYISFELCTVLLKTIFLENHFIAFFYSFFLILCQIKQQPFTHNTYIWEIECTMHIVFSLFSFFVLWQIACKTKNEWKKRNMKCATCLFNLLVCYIRNLYESKFITQHSTQNTIQFDNFVW